MAYTTDIEYVFCTSEDVRAYAHLLTREIEDVSEDTYLNVEDSEIDLHITLATGIVLGALEGYYGGESALQVSSPYIRRPTMNKNNQSKVILLKAGLESAAITEQWTLKLKTPTGSENIRFELWGSVSGYQGTGTDEANFESDDSLIQILTTYWKRPDDIGQSEDGDEIYFSTYKHKRIIVSITSMLAAGKLLNAILANQTEDGSRLGESYINRAMKLLEKLANPEKSGMSLLTAPTTEIDITGISYQINSLGVDDTKYNSNISKNDENPDVVGF